MQALPVPGLLEAVAVRTPVLPATAWNCQHASRQRPLLLGGTLLAMSTTFVMPGGAAHVALLVIMWNVTSMSLAAVVVTLGVEWVSDDGVPWPFWTSMTVAVSTPWNPRMQPAEPWVLENVHVWVAGSLAVATRR